MHGQFHSNKLLTAVAKWVATPCRPINIVEDEGLLEIFCTVSNNGMYELSSRAATVNKIQSLHEDKKAKVELGQPSTFALTGGHWTSPSDRSY